MEPKIYQNEGIDFLAERNIAFQGDDAGLGKSMQLIRAAEKAGVKRILVLGPAIARVSWAIQFQTWDRQNLPVYQYPYETGGLIPAGDCVIIVTMDWLSDKKKAKSFNAMLRVSERFGAAFIDEAHFLKTPTANRTQAIYGRRGPEGSVVEMCDRVWVASATLTPLNAGELYPHMRALLPEVLEANFGGKVPSHGAFIERYCDVHHGNFGRQIRGNNKNTIPELKNAFAPYIIKRLKSEVLPELDPIIADLFPVEITDPNTDAALPPELAPQAVEDLPEEEFLERLRIAYGPDEQYSTARKALGTLKAEAVIPWIKDFLNSDLDRKLVIFAHHRDVIALLWEKLNDNYGVSTITGATPTTLKSEEVRRFQEDRTTRVFAGQTRAAGTAITLTAASEVLLLEPDPSPDNNYQAISRCHRLGQTSSVTARFVYSANNHIERRLARTLARRAADNSELFGGEARGFIPANQ